MKTVLKSVLNIAMRKVGWSKEMMDTFITMRYPYKKVIKIFTKGGGLQIMASLKSCHKFYYYVFKVMGCVKELVLASNRMESLRD